jgi:Tfp pilus assembly protein PilX
METTKHPLVVLLAATILGSAVVPFVNARIARDSRDNELKLSRAMEALRASATTERQINELQTEFMLFAKNDLWDNVQARRDVQSRLSALYGDFNRDAWWWYWQLLQEVRLLRLVDEASIREVRSSIEEYSANLQQTTREAAPLWSLLNGRPLNAKVRRDTLESAAVHLEALRQKRQALVRRMIEPLVR